MNDINRSLTTVVRRNRTNARMIPMLTRMAVSLRSTLESMAMPCSVNTCGK